MKKLLAIIIVIICVLTSFIIGKNFGINHAMTNAKVSFYNGTVAIEIDGQLYEHYAE